MHNCALIPKNVAALKHFIANLVVFCINTLWHHCWSKLQSGFKQKDVLVYHITVFLQLQDEYIQSPNSCFSCFNGPIYEAQHRVFWHALLIKN